MVKTFLKKLHNFGGVLAPNSARRANAEWCGRCSAADARTSRLRPRILSPVEPRPLLGLRPANVQGAQLRPQSLRVSSPRTALNVFHFPLSAFCLSFAKRIRFLFGFSIVLVLGCFLFWIVSE